MTDPFVGQLTFVRVYSGVLTKGETVLNATKGKKERIGRIVQMHANERQEVDEIRAGDIAACVGLKDVTTGETLCDVSRPIVLERMVFPEPVIPRPVEPKPRPTKKKSGIALSRLAARRPVLPRAHRRRIGPDHHRRYGRAAPGTSSSTSMKREFNVEANVGQAPSGLPRNHSRPVKDVDGKFVRQSGGKGQYGHVVFRLEPTKLVKALSSWTKSKAVWCRANTSLLCKRVWKRP